MPPEFEFDPILDIIKEADEKLNFIKTTPSKKESGKGKKKKSSKTKVSKANKSKKVSVKNDQDPGESLPAISSSEATISRSGDDIVDPDTKDDALESVNVWKIELNIFYVTFSVALLCDFADGPVSINALKSWIV